MAASRFLLLCFIFAFAVPSFARLIATDPKVYEDTQRNNPLTPSIEHHHQLLDEGDRVKLSENSEMKVEDIDIDYKGTHTHPCPPDHCPP